MDRRDAPQAPIAGTLAYLLAGPIIWAAQFTLVYGGHTLACLGGASAFLVRGLIVGTTVAAALAIVAFLIRQRHVARRLGLAADTAGRATYDRMARVGAGLSLLAVMWSGTAVLLVGTCVQGR